MDTFSYQQIIKKGAYSVISLFALSVISCKEPKTDKVNDTVRLYSGQLKEKFQQNITGAISTLDSILIDFSNAKKHYTTSRNYFKKIEPLLSSLDVENYNYLIQPNILKIDEDDHTDIKLKSPSGYQVIEEKLYEHTVDTAVLKKHINKVVNRLQLVKKNTRFEHLKEYHFLWMLRKSVIRTALTGITGFDSPVQENSLEDAKHVYTSLREFIKIYKNKFQNISVYESWVQEINQTIEDLQGDFNTFDRYTFIKKHIHPQLNLWNQTVNDWETKFPFELAISNDTESLFSTGTFNESFFSDYNLGKNSIARVELGKKLFYDKKLSANQHMNCATCHKPELAFTDGKKIAPGTTRNSPMLMYAGLQQGYFYDKRAGSLEGQIVAVINNENEFHSNLKNLENVILQDSSYYSSFKKAYPDTKISNMTIRSAIASYIRSLAPFNSKFDKNINNLENTLTSNEINGFNLFMGKAKCATCHFAPLFNGTVPPDYKETELELIGVPEKKDTINAMISSDLGRYHVYKTEERKHFFKTPTIRNASLTSPYMHNGVYTTLDEVIDFYNRGGGAGIGIAMENQTLPADKLNLTQKEQNDLIAFIKSLEDPINNDY